MISQTPTQLIYTCPANVMFIIYSAVVHHLRVKLLLIIFLLAAERTEHFCAS